MDPCRAAVPLNWRLRSPLINAIIIVVNYDREETYMARWIKPLLAAALLLMLMAFAASAETTSVVYADANGNAMPARDCTKIDGGTRSIDTGWYAVTDTVTIDGTLSINGNHRGKGKSSKMGFSHAAVKSIVFCIDFFHIYGKIIVYFI